MSAPAAFRFNDRASRYISPAGQFVSQATVNDALNSAVKAAARDMHALTQQLREGTLAIQDWQAAMMQAVKDSQLASAALAKGGFAQMTQADYGRVGQSVRAQYGYLQTFAQQLADGSIALDGRVPRRAELYVEAARGMFDKQQRADMRRRGMTEERNILNATESCDGCLDATALGWVPIGTLPPVGTRTCLSRCACSVIFR